MTDLISLESGFLSNQQPNVPLAQYEALMEDHKQALFYLGALQALLEDYLKAEPSHA